MDSNILKGTPEFLGEKLLTTVRSNPINTSYALELIELGAKLTCATSTGESPIIFAAFAGNLAIVQAMIEKGIDIETRGSAWNTVFLTACYYDQTETALYLMKKGADVNAVNKFNLNGIGCAACNNNLPLVKAIFENGGQLGNTLEAIKDPSTKTETYDFVVSCHAEMEKQKKAKAIYDAMVIPRTLPAAKQNNFKKKPKF